MKILPLAALAFLCGCYTAPKSVVGFDNDRAYGASFDRTWTALIDYVTSKGVDIGAIEKESGLLTIPATGAARGDCDCGSGLGLNITERRASVSFLLQPINDSLTQVRVTCNFSGWNTSTLFNPGWVGCQSRGEMEQRIFAGIAERLPLKSTAIPVDGK